MKNILITKRTVAFVSSDSRFSFPTVLVVNCFYKSTPGAR